MADNIAKFLEALGIALWGVSGGIAHLFVSGRRPTFYAFLSCVFVSGFAGLMVGRIMEAGDMPRYFTEFAIGMGGFGGPITLNLLYRKMAKTGLGASDNEIADAKAESENNNEVSEDTLSE